MTVNMDRGRHSETGMWWIHTSDSTQAMGWLRDTGVMGLSLACACMHAQRKYARIGEESVREIKEVLE